jgi:hypothetical protein
MKLHNANNRVPELAYCAECPPRSPQPKPPREGPVLSLAERGRLGGRRGHRRHGKYPKAMPWWEQALRDYAEANPSVDLDAMIAALYEFRNQRRRKPAR